LWLFCAYSLFLVNGTIGLLATEGDTPPDCCSHEEEKCGASWRQVGLLVQSLQRCCSRCACVRAYVHVVCVYVHMCMYVCVWTCTYVYICMCICICIRMHVYPCIYVCVRTRCRVCTRVYIHFYVYMHAHVYGYICASMILLEASW